MHADRPILRLRFNKDQIYTFSPSEVVVLGRDPTSTVVSTNGHVSRRHLQVSFADGVWSVEDLGSTKGTFVDGARITKLPVSGRKTLWLGGEEIGDRVDIALAEADGAPHGQSHQAAQVLPVAIARSSLPVVSSHQVVGTTVRIGRAPDNDLSIPDDLRVSKHHAELRQQSTGSYQIVDLSSHNGTFVNGQRTTRQRLQEGDLVAVGNHLFRFTAGVLEQLAQAGAATLEGSGLTVRTPEGSTILADVSLYLPGSSLLAVVGGSGAGKTTMLKALSGMRQADKGSVFFGGRDLYGSLDELRRQIGVVPQEDILHTQLTVRQALDYAAALRFPADVPPEARAQRVSVVLTELDIGNRASLRIDRLSGGQRKRVNVALELLTTPALLFLDEPTSGLDPGNEQNVMQLLRTLADGGRTVVVVTHSIQSLHLCDRVLFLAPGGKLAFFGPPNDVLPFFQSHGVGPTYADVFSALETDPDQWAARFQSHRLYDQYVAQPLAIRGNLQSIRTQLPAPAPPQSAVRQFQVLARRYLSVIRADRKALLLLILQAPIFGLLFLLLFNKKVLAIGQNGFQGVFLLWLLVAGASWLGVSNASREIVKELPIYRRERAVGLSPGAYLASKVVVLGVITVIQCAVMTGLAIARQDVGSIENVAAIQQAYPVVYVGQSEFGKGAVLPSKSAELVLDVMLGGLAAMALGLLVSSLTKTSDQALVLIPILLVALLVLSQPFPSSADESGQTAHTNPVLQVLGYGASSEWSKNAAGATVDLNTIVSPSILGKDLGTHYLLEIAQLEAPYTSQELYDLYGAALVREPKWKHTSGVWLRSTAVVVAMILLFLSALYVRLRGSDHSR
jgi:ABC transport system ATP-binding/permease protein